MAINVDKMSMRELAELEAKVAKVKVQARERAKTETKDKIDRILEATGFTIGEIYGFSKGRGRGKAAAKYANPDDRSQTWTGRGRKPNWLVAKLKKGSKQEDFTI